jgi:hemerythrin superfamily protein
VAIPVLHAIGMPRTAAVLALVRRARCVSRARSRPARRGETAGVQCANRRAMGTAKSKSTETNVLDLLTSQHDEVDQLMEKIEKGKGDVRGAFQELADKLAAHATVEEKIFYPAAMSEKTHDLLHESVEEHLEIKRTLADMLMLDVESDEFKAKLSVLKENVSHHAHEEEEDKMFPMLRRMMSEDELSAIGNQVLVMFEELMQQHPSRNVPNETKKAAPLPQL